MAAIAGFVGFLVAIGGFFSMTRTFKIIFILYLAGSAYYIFSIAGSASLGESITALNLIFGAIGVLAFGIIWSNLEAKESRRRFLSFILKYGLAYLALVTGAKLVIFAFSGDYSGRTWEAVSAMVALMPYKWLVFLIVILLYHGIRAKSRGRSRQ